MVRLGRGGGDRGVPGLGRRHQRDRVVAVNVNTRCAVAEVRVRHLEAALDVLVTGLGEVVATHQRLANETQVPSARAHQRGLADGKDAVRQELIAILSRHRETEPKP